jgi:prepilin signal peptidase PulO-like enzyme (type II secretory pathway)
MQNLVIGYIALLGLIVGSAINAIVWRLYVGRSWVRGRSMCPECKHKLAAKDLVPVFSWLVLGGKCRYCKAKIHWQYPVVEIITAGLFALSASRMMPQTWLDGLQLALWLVMLTMLIVLTVYDFRWMILPDKVVYPAILLAGVWLMLGATEAFDLHTLAGPTEAAVLAGAMFYALAAISKGRAMGGGDIKLVFLMGLLLGLKGTMLALLIAFNTGAIFGLLMLALHRKKRRDHIPFGPFLVLGTLVAFLYGQDIVQWYLTINGLA